MKKTFTFLLVITSVIAFGQPKSDSTTAAKEKAKQDSILYVSKILSMQDVDRIMMAKKNEISVADWEVFWLVMNRMLLPEATQEFKNKSAAKKP
jgi:hypothetical protein